MSIVVDGFECSNAFVTIKEIFDQLPQDNRRELLDQINGVFEFQVKNAQGKTQVWTADMKNDGTVVLGERSDLKPDVVVSLDDKDFTELASGKLSGPKAFMAGKLKVKGELLLAMRLDTMLKVTRGINPLADPNAAAPDEAQAEDVTVPGYNAAVVFQQIANMMKSYSPQELESQKSKARGIFQFDIKNAAGQTQSWTIDLKHDGRVVRGKIEGKKPDVTVQVKDNDFLDMALGKIGGQRAFMTGKLKLKGNIMQATKLDAVMKTYQDKARL
ncbi:uncharacterized protein VTP21DRAFT_796 [Calcarisporiella thermophila]|uniref:uncharacterized protein n=1 Tax=Calcarisporiella thermophila TaxID=911321 RepID=UPI003743961A